jgi:hypothetical protein
MDGAAFFSETLDSVNCEAVAEVSEELIRANRSLVLSENEFSANTRLIEQKKDKNRNNLIMIQSSFDK